MKKIGVCEGCGRELYVNESDLCKRCNREATRHISHEELDKRRAELAELAKSSAGKKAKSAPKKEEAAEGEEEAESKEEPKEEKKD